MLLVNLSRTQLVINWSACFAGRYTEPQKNPVPAVLRLEVLRACGLSDAVGSSDAWLKGEGQAPDSAALLFRENRSPALACVRGPEASALLLMSTTPLSCVQIAGNLGRAKQQGPHACARLILPAGLRAASLQTPAQAASFCPDFLEQRDAPVLLDAAAVRVLATQVQLYITRTSEARELSYSY